MKIDVAIVGASSAGLYAAEKLAQANQRVVVFERSSALSHQRRTLIVTPHLLHILGYRPGAALLHEISIMDVATPQATVSIKLQEPDLIIERNAFIRHLAARAEAAGATICYGHRFACLEAVEDGVLLSFRSDRGDLSVTAGAVIGADGLHSSIATAANMQRPPSVPIVQAEVKLPATWDPGVTKVWFDVHDTRFFYWLIPESATKGVVGLVGDNGLSTRRLLERFLTKHGFSAEAYQGARVAMYEPGLRPWGRVGDAPVLLVGDAAGQVKVTTVGGSVSGLWGAQAAVNAILNRRAYARELAPLKRELNLHYTIRALLERLDNAGYDQLLNHLMNSGRRFLGRYNRDEMARHFWKLPLYQPRLLLLGLRLLSGRPVRQFGQTQYASTGPDDDRSSALKGQFRQEEGEP